MLTETLAIAGWLEARDVERRISFDPVTPAADRMHQLMAFLNTGFTGAFSPLWAALELESARPGLSRDLARLWPQGSRRRHAQLEAMIGDSPFLAGDRPTLADAVLIGVGRWAEFHEAADSQHIRGWRRCVGGSRRTRPCASR